MWHIVDTPALWVSEERLAVNLVNKNCRKTRVRTEFGMGSSFGPSSNPHPPGATVEQLPSL